MALNSANEGLPKEQQIEIRQIKYLNNIMEQDHRFIKKRTRPMLGFKSFRSAKITIYDKDHIHVMVSIPPKYNVGKVVGIIKANTARRLREKFPDFFKKVYWGNKGIWSSGYFVSTVEINKDIIKKYIERQGEEDEGRTEFVTD